MKGLKVLGRMAASCLLTVVATTSAQAAAVEYAGRIARLYTFTTFSSGDIVISVSNPPSGCDGFWLRMSDPGAKNTYAQLLAAQHTEQVLRIGALDNEWWTGSASHFCRIDFVTQP